MEGNQETTLFRKQTIDKISSPEQLNGYLRVTNPGVWALLVTVAALLAGLLAWSAVGTLETAADARAIVRDHIAEIVPTRQGAESVASGMPLYIASQEFLIASVDTDAYGRIIARAEVSLPDGEYDAKIVVERTRPISFLLESR